MIVIVIILGYLHCTMVFHYSKTGGLTALTYKNKVIISIFTYKTQGILCVCLTNDDIHLQDTYFPILNYFFLVWSKIGKRISKLIFFSNYVKDFFKC